MTDSLTLLGLGHNPNFPNGKIQGRRYHHTKTRVKACMDATIRKQPSINGVLRVVKALV